MDPSDKASKQATNYFQITYIYPSTKLKEYLQGYKRKKGERRNLAAI